MKTLVVLLFIPILSFGQPYFISPNGDDGNGNGSRGNPWFNVGYAMNQCSAGDTVYALSGTYNYNFNQSIQVSGTAGNYITLTSEANHPDSVIFDFWNYDVSGEAPKSISGIGGANRSYLKFERFSLRRLWKINTDNGQAYGMSFNDCDFIDIEWLVIDSIAGRGIQGYRSGTANFRNLDISWCADPQDDDPGNGGTGLIWYQLTASPMDTVRVTGCRFWQCADQGIGILTGNVAIVDSVWSWDHGLKEEGYWFGSGIGMKTALGYNTDIDTLHVMIKRSIMAFNHSYGYDENTTGGHRNNLHVYNNTIYGNGGAGIMSTRPTGSLDNTVRYHNNISFGNTSWDMQIQLSATHSYNSFDEPYHSTDAKYLPSYFNSPSTVNADNFIALPTDRDHCTTILGAERKSNGSLPDIGDYFQLAPDSDLIDKGTPVGLPYNGNAPDMGAFESGDKPNEEYGSEKATILPNPNDGNFTLFLNEPFQEETIINIFSLEGQPVYTDTLQSNEMFKIFNLGNLEPDKYILTINGALIFLTKIFIKL